LSNRKAVWLSSDSMSRRICRASSNCSALSMRLRIMKLTARRVSITLRRMRPFRSSCRAMAPSTSPASVVADVAFEHFLARDFEFVVDVLECVGRVFGVGIEQLEQHFLRVFDESGRAARAHAQQAEHGHVFVVDRKQHAAAAKFGVVLVQDERNAHRARVFVVVDQEVGADVQLAVVFFIEAGRLLDVLVHRVFWNREAVVLLDPALFLERGRFEVDPDRLELGKLLQGLDLFLDEAAVGERKDIEHGSLP
jgi:hypothetical protein